MNLEFSEEQTLLTNLVERYATDHYDLAKRAAYLRLPEGFSQKNWALLSETGILMIPFSESYGGLGGNAEDFICVMQALGKAVAVEPVLFSTILAGSLLEAVGTQAQKNDWIPKVISGEKHLALAHFEAAARYDLSYVKTEFRQDNNQTHLTGRKTFILGAAAADSFIVSAVPDKTNDSKEDISFFLVNKDAENMVSRHYKLTDGSIAFELDFNNTLATPMAGNYDDFEAVICLTKIGACAEMVGLMELLFEETLQHVKTREQFGRPLSKMQVIQHRLADSFVSLELSKSHLLRMAASSKKDSNYIKMTAGSKAFIARAAMKLAEEAVQLHGGMGITDELIVGHAMKRILILSTLFGDPDTELLRFSRSTA